MCLNSVVCLFKPYSLRSRQGCVILHVATVWTVAVCACKAVSLRKGQAQWFSRAFELRVQGGAKSKKEGDGKSRDKGTVDKSELWEAWLWCFSKIDKPWVVSWFGHFKSTTSYDFLIQKTPSYFCCTQFKYVYAWSWTHRKWCMHDCAYLHLANSGTQTTSSPQRIRDTYLCGGLLCEIIFLYWQIKQYHG